MGVGCIFLLYQCCERPIPVANPRDPASNPASSIGVDGIPIVEWKVMLGRSLFDCHL